MRMISQRCFPLAVEKENYNIAIENINDEDARKFLKALCITGFRAIEMLNGYFFMDVDGAVYARAPSAKTGQHLIEKFGRKYAGSIILKSFMDSPNFWKSVKINNYLNLNITELIPAIEPNTRQNIRVFFADTLHKKAYHGLYKALKRELPALKIAFYPSPQEEASKEVYSPSFHFFRKLFAAETYEQDKDIVATVQKMKWKNFGRILQYVKLYRE